MKIIFLVNLFVLMFCELAHAEEPIFTYHIYGATPTVHYTTVDELIANYNAKEAAVYSACMANAGPTFNCTEHQIVGQEGNNLFAVVNGVYLMTYLQRERKNTAGGPNYPTETSISDGGTIAAAANYSCPSILTAKMTVEEGLNRTVTCIPPPEESCDKTPATENPIRIQTGEKVLRETDYESADGLLSVERTYRSQSFGWVFNDPVAVGSSDIDGIHSCAFGQWQTFKQYAVTGPDPSEVIVAKVIYRCPGLAQLNRIEPDFYLPFKGGALLIGRSQGAYIVKGENTANFRIAESAESSGWLRLTDAENTHYFYNTSGRLSRIEYSSGQEIQYLYENGLLVSKQDRFGHALHFEYDGEDRLATVVLPDGGRIEYDYLRDSQGPEFAAISSVTWPSGRKKFYHYNEAHLTTDGRKDYLQLTGVSNSVGERLFTYEYSGLKAVREYGPDNFQLRVLNDMQSAVDVTDSYGTKRRYNFNFIDDDGRRFFTGVSQPGGSGCTASTSSQSFYDNELLKSKTDFAGNSRVYGYDEARRLLTVSVSDIAGEASESLLAQSAELPVSASKITREWNSVWRLPNVIWRAGIKETYVYNGELDPLAGNSMAACSSATVANPTASGLVPAPRLCRRILQQTNDSNGQLGNQAQLLNNAIFQNHEYTYDAQGRMLTEHRNGRLEVQYTYYPELGNFNDGRLASRENVLGHRQVFEQYSADGRPKNIVDENGAVTALTYDSAGRVLSMSWAGGNENYVYDIEGRLVNRQLVSGAQLYYSYNVVGLLVRISDDVGGAIEFNYDTEGQLLNSSIFDSANTVLFRQAFSYDALGRMEFKRDAEGNQSQYFYNPNGLLTQKINPRNHDENYQYASDQSLKMYQDQDGGSVAFSHNGQGAVSAVSDQRGLTTTYDYDGFGNLVSQNSPDTGVTLYNYDNYGNRIRRTDARGVLTEYDYDLLDRLVAVRYPSSPQFDTRYVYDQVVTDSYSIGRLTSVADASGATAYTYDKYGRVLSKAVDVAGQHYITSYEYDLQGLVSKVIYPSGRHVRYNRDGYGHIVAVYTQADSQSAEQVVVADALYYPFGPLISFSYGNGLLHSLTYNENFQLQANDVSGITAPMALSYQYDENGNIAVIDNFNSVGKTERYSYDAVDRLTGAESADRTFSYAYDSVGNRLERIIQQGGDEIFERYLVATDSNRVSQVTSEGATNSQRNFQYDANGNRVAEVVGAGDSVVSEYAADNRYRGLLLGGQLLAEYKYNAAGQRVVKNTPNGQEHFHYNEQGNLLSVTNGLGVTSLEYIYLDGQPVAMLGAAPTQFAPVTHDDVLLIEKNTTRLISAQALLQNDTDGNQDSLHISDIVSVTSGDATLDTNGDISYVPAFNFSGVATLIYTVSDETGLTSQATLTLYVGNQPPQAVDDKLGVSNTVSTVISTARLLQNDIDPDGDVLRVESVGSVSIGSVTLSADTITYTPQPGVVGTATFTYTVSDDQGGLSTAVAELLLVTLGSSGNDTIQGAAGDDVIEAGAGDDTLNGGAGSDTYIWRLGDGNDTITNYDTSVGVDILALYGVVAGDVRLQRSNSNLWVHLPDGAKVTVNNFFTGEPAFTYRIDFIEFEGGTQWGFDFIKQQILLPTDANDTLMGFAADDVIQGGAGNDTLYGYAGDDTLEGEAGNDTLYGGDDNDILRGGQGTDNLMGDAGNDLLEGGTENDSLNGGTGSDTYVWRIGDGSDTITNYDTSVGVDTLALYGVLVSDVRLQRSNSNLWVHLPDGAKITVNNFFTGEPAFANRIDFIEFEDGTQWGFDFIKQQILLPTDANDTLMGFAVDDVIQGGAGNDTLYGYAGDDTLEGEDGNDTLYGGDDNDILRGGQGTDNLMGDAGNDLLEGGTENDSLNGGTGSDTYIWRLGDGDDTITNYDTSVGVDTLALYGVLVSDVRLQRSNSNLWVHLPDGAKITVNNFFTGEPAFANRIDFIEFEDGTQWGFDFIKQQILLPTDANDTLMGFAVDDLIQGGAGNDTLHGYAGNDQLNGDADNDSIFGGDGDDLLQGGSGADTLNGENGNDILNGGIGNDTLNGGAGSDTYLWSVGDGSDSINNYDTSAGREDVLRLLGVSVSEISFTRSGNHLWVNLPDSAKITVSNFFIGVPTTTSYALNWIELDDGTKWSPSDLATLTAN